MPEDFSGGGVVVEGLDFSEHGIEVPESPEEALNKKRSRLKLEQESARLDAGESPLWLQAINKVVAPAVEAAHAFPANLINLPSLITGGHPLVAPGQPIIHVPIEGPQIAESIRQSPVLSGTILGANPELTGGVTRGTLDVAEGFTTPEMAGVAATLPKAAPFIQRAVAAGFAAQMGSQVPEAAARFGESTVTQPPVEQFRHGTSLAAQIALPALLGLHGEVSTRPPLLLPRSLDALREAAVKVPETVKAETPLQLAPTPAAPRHPLLAAADAVDQVAAQVAQTGQAPHQTVTAALDNLRARLAEARARAAQAGQMPVAAATETMAGGRAAPPSAADAAFEAANVALDEAQATVNRWRVPESTEPQADIPALTQALVKAANAVRGYQTTVQQRQQQEVSGALQERETTPILRDVPRESLPSPGEMPAETGAVGIPRSVEAEKEAGRPEVPVTTEPAAKPSPEPTVASAEAPIGEGPGAKTTGASKYPAIQQLTDQLEATPKVGTKQGLRLGEKIADTWSRKGDLVTKAVGRMVNAKNTLLKWQEGIRRASDIDSHLGEYDYAIQYSTAVSKRAGEAIKRQMPDVTDRDAAAILIDSARIATKDPARLAVNPDALATPAEVRQVIKNALVKLPKETPKSVRSALERALDPSLELRQFTESLKQYFGIREQDAVGADLFEEGLQDYYTHIWQKEANMPGSLRNAIASGRVNTYFQFARQRTIPSLIEGILEGKKPVLDPAKVVPFYNFAMDRAIASRTFIRALSDMKASDGRPAVDVRGGAVVQDPLDAKSDPALLITPKTQARELTGYMSINHPAMQKWKWLTKTPEGRQVFMRGEMVVHPEFHDQLARFMDRSRLTESTGVRRALAFSATAKGLKLGLLPSTFHIVHVGTHAAFHWTNPFKWAPIDFEAPATRFAIEKGHLKLAPSPAELSALQEGVAATGLVRKIPYVGEWAGALSDLMFHQYIPRLKLNTFENAMSRARSPLTATGRALKAGRLTENDVSARVGDAVNNAFGELNQLFLGKFGRDPKFQRALRLIFLAPDFGEARLRFLTKGFARYGSEERLALATMGIGLYFGARVGNWLSHGNAEADDWRHAFEVKMRDEKGNSHWVGMRSVVGDMVHALERPGQFLYVRLNPAYARPTADFLYGREERTGRKLSAQERMVRAAQAFEPIGLGGLTEPDRTILESLGQSMGFANRRDMAVNDIARKAHEWREKQGLMPMVEVIPTDEPAYLKLRTALNIGKTGDAKKILAGLLKTRSHKQVEKAMVTYLEHPYAGSNELEKQWVSTFTKEDAQLYLKAQQEKENTLVDFYKLLGATLKK